MLSNGELYSMGRPSCQYFPIILRAERVECLRDFDRFRPGNSVVITAQVKTPHVFQAVQKMHRASFVIYDGDRVVNRIVTCFVQILSCGDGVQGQVAAAA